MNATLNADLKSRATTNKVQNQRIQELEARLVEFTRKYDEAKKTYHKLKESQEKHKAM